MKISGVTLSMVDISREEGLVVEEEVASAGKDEPSVFFWFEIFWKAKEREPI